jgi:hypothetical protein
MAFNKDIILAELTRILKAAQACAELAKDTDHYKYDFRFGRQYD